MRRSKLVVRVTRSARGTRRFPEYLVDATTPTADAPATGVVYRTRSNRWRWEDDLTGVVGIRRYPSRGAAVGGLLAHLAGDGRLP